MEAPQPSASYWVPMDSFSQTPPPLYEITPEIHTVSANDMNGSPDSANFDPYTIPFQTAYPHVTDNLSYSYQGSGPMTPESSCIDDSPYGSPQLSIAHIYPSPPLPSSTPSAAIPRSSVSPRTSISDTNNIHMHLLNSAAPFSLQQAPAVVGGEKTHATSSRRRAQNRAAQRAFRERKEKHARDLEEALAAMTAKWQAAEGRVRDVEARYEKMRRTVELLVGCQEAKRGEGKGEAAAAVESETLRKVLEVLCGDDEGVKREE